MSQFHSNSGKIVFPVFAISANRTDGSGENFLFAKTVVVASGAYVNLNNWLEVGTWSA